MNLRCYRFIAALLICALPLLASNPNGVSLRVVDEIAPARGLAQIHIELTEPKPITGGDMAFAFDEGLLMTVTGVDLLGSGDVAGVAFIEAGRVYVRFIAPSGTFGTDPDYPIMVVAIPVSPTAQPGQPSTIALDASGSLFLDPNGQPYPVETKPGTFTVGGVSITQIIPRSGTVAAGQTIIFSGVGFQSDAKLDIDGVALASTRVVSSTQIFATAAQTFLIDGRRIRVRNPDGSMETYYSYAKGTTLGRSAYALLAAAEPIFAKQSYLAAVFSTVKTGLIGGVNYLDGLSFRNLNDLPAQIHIEVYNPAAALTGSAEITLAPGGVITRDLTELIPGLAPQDGGYIRVFSTQPVQMLELLGPETGNTLTPASPAPM